MVLKLLADASVKLWQCFKYTEASKEVFEIEFTGFPWEWSGNMLCQRRNSDFKQCEGYVRNLDNPKSSST